MTTSRVNDLAGRTAPALRRPRVDDAPRSADSVLRLAVLMPAYNASASVRTAMQATVAGLRRAHGVVAQLTVVDDGSADDTADVARAAGHALTQPATAVRVWRQPENQGLVATLHVSYPRLLRDAFRPTHIVKVDADADYPQDESVRVLCTGLRGGHPFVLATRPEAVLPASEAGARADLLPRLTRAGLPTVDPAAMGCYAISAQLLARVLALPPVATHAARWGLDFAIFLGAAHLAGAPHVVELPGTQHDPTRRPAAKVAAQFAAYHQILDRFASLGVVPSRAASA